MSNVIFPSAVRGLTYNVTKTPEFSTINQRAVSAAETRIVNWQNPIWHWELIYDYLWDDPGNIAVGLTQTDLRTLMGFYMARQGMFDSFLYSDPNDNTVAPADQQLVVVTSGGIYYTPVQRLFGGQFYEDITDFDGTPAFYANAILQVSGTDYTVLGPGVAIDGYSFAGYVLQWTAPPTQPITGAFSYFFRARFDVDQVVFEEFVNNLWTIGGGSSQKSDVLKLTSARVPLA